MEAKNEHSHCYLSDIAYFQGYIEGESKNGIQITKKILCGNLENTTLDLNSSKNDCLVGTLKNSAWKHEDETRLIIKKGNADSYKQTIDIDLPDDFFKGIIVDTGPFCEINIKNIEEKLKEINNSINIKVSQSYFCAKKITKYYYSKRE